MSPRRSYCPPPCHLPDGEGEKASKYFKFQEITSLSQGFTKTHTNSIPSLQNPEEQDIHLYSQGWER